MNPRGLGSGGVWGCCLGLVPRVREWPWGWGLGWHRWKEREGRERGGPFEGMRCAQPTAHWLGHSAPQQGKPRAHLARLCQHGRHDVVEGGAEPEERVVGEVLERKLALRGGGWVGRAGCLEVCGRVVVLCERAHALHAAAARPGVSFPEASRTQLGFDASGLGGKKKQTGRVKQDLPPHLAGVAGVRGAKHRVAVAGHHLAGL